MLDLNFKQVSNKELGYVIKKQKIHEEPKKEGKYHYVPELKTHVFIRKGNTLKKWLKKQKENGLISETLWVTVIKPRYKV